MKKILITLLTVFLGTILLNACGDSSKKVEEGSKVNKVVKWKMASTFPGNLTILGEGALNLTKRVDLVSNEI